MLLRGHIILDRSFKFWVKLSNCLLWFYKLFFLYNTANVGNDIVNDKMMKHHFRQLDIILWVFFAALEGSLSDQNTLFVLFPWVGLCGGGIPLCPQAPFSRPAELDKQTRGPVNLSGQMWGFGATASYAGTSANCLCAK